MDVASTRSGLNIPIVTSVVIVTSVAAFFWPALGAALVYERVAILDGQMWRLVTGHTVHFSSMHLVYNVVAFGIGGLILERINGRRFVWLCLYIALVISSILIVLRPEMALYGGLSGIASGLIYYLALGATRRGGMVRLVGWMVCVAIPIKMWLETARGESTLPYFGDQGFRLVYEAHWAGVIAAVAWFLVERCVRTQRRLVPESAAQTGD